MASSWKDRYYKGLNVQRGYGIYRRTRGVRHGLQTQSAQGWSSIINGILRYLTPIARGAAKSGIKAGLKKASSSGLKEALKEGLKTAAKKGGKTLLREGGKTLLSEGGKILSESAGNLTADVAGGANVKEAFNKQVVNLKNKVDESLSNLKPAADVEDNVFKPGRPVGKKSKTTGVTGVKRKGTPSIFDKFKSKNNRKR